MIEIPTVTFGGDATALLFENHPGSDLEVLAHARYEDNPRAFLDLVLDTLRTHYPVTARRVNEDEFDLANGPLDILQGGVTPTVRHSHIKLANGATRNRQAALGNHDDERTGSSHCHGRVQPHRRSDCTASRRGRLRGASRCTSRQRQLFVRDARGRTALDRITCSRTPSRITNPVRIPRRERRT
jgi:hypothetical protein